MAHGSTCRPCEQGAIGRARASSEQKGSRCGLHERFAVLAYGGGWGPLLFWAGVCHGSLRGRPRKSTRAGWSLRGCIRRRALIDTAPPQPSPRLAPPPLRQPVFRFWPALVVVFLFFPPHARASRPQARVRGVRPAGSRWQTGLKQARGRAHEREFVPRASGQAHAPYRTLTVPMPVPVPVPALPWAPCSRRPLA